MEHSNELIVIGAVAVTSLILSMNYLWDALSRKARFAVRERVLNRSGHRSTAPR